MSRPKTPPAGVRLPAPPVEPEPPRLELEANCAELGRLLRKGMGPGVGFALVLFDFGPKGSMAYTGTGVRQDVIKMLAELLDKLRADTCAAELERAPVSPPCGPTGGRTCFAPGIGRACRRSTGAASFGGARDSCGRKPFGWRLSTCGASTRRSGS